MQRISRGRAVPHRGNGAIRRRRQPSPRCTVQPVATLGVATLAPAFTQALPQLATIPSAYNHKRRAELLYDLCAALVREELAGPELWQKCDASSVVFAQRAIMGSI